MTTPQHSGWNFGRGSLKHNIVTSGACHRAVLIGVLATTALTCNASAQAQSADTLRNEAGSDDIVVTARKREETLISVHVTVSALTGAAIHRYNATDIPRQTGRTTSRERECQHG